MAAMKEIPGLPTKGWNIDGVTDLGRDRSLHRLCEYCGQELVRYLHTLRHPSGSWPILDVGCVCAGRLSGDPDRARALDAAARNVSARRANFCGLAGWTPTRKPGTLRLRHDHRVFAVTQGKFGSWAGSWTWNDGDGAWVSVKGWHRDLNAAKLGLFDAVYGTATTTGRDTA